jgi:hypothetical protein
MRASSGARPTLRSSFGQVVAQDHRTVVKDVVRAVEQGHGAPLSGLEDRLPNAGVRV